MNIFVEDSRSNDCIISFYNDTVFIISIFIFCVRAHFQKYFSNVCTFSGNEFNLARRFVGISDIQTIFRCSTYFLFFYFYTLGLTL